MKKLKKRDFKKLAIMGIAGGTALSAQANASEGVNPNTVDPSQLLAYANCGGHGGCGGYTAYRQPSNYYYNQAPQGCQSVQPGYGQGMQQGCQAQQPYYQGQPYYQEQQPSNMMPQQQQPSQGCGGMTQPVPQVSYKCGGARPWQPIAGCNAPTPNQGTMPNQPNGNGAAPMETPKDNVKKGEAYTQWETADNYQPQRKSYSFSNMQEPKDNGSDSQGSMKQESTKNGKMTESDLMSQLNPQAKATYQSMDAAGKALALKMANQSCKGQNDCKGMNSCKTEDHACAGKGACAGTSTGPFKDKNLAVKVASMKMAEKRANAASPKY